MLFSLCIAILFFILFSIATNYKWEGEPTFGKILLKTLCIVAIAMAGASVYTLTRYLLKF